MENLNNKNIDAKAAAVREKLEDESLDKCKVEGGMTKGRDLRKYSSSDSGK